MIGEHSFREMAEQVTRRRPGDAETIETRDVSYTVIYGQHDSPQEHPPLERLDAVILELIGDRRAQTHATDLERVQYRPLAEEAKRLGKPLFFTDVNEWDDTELKKNLQILVGMPLLAAYAVGERVTQDRTEPTRRAVLFGGAAASLAGAAVMRQPALQAWEIVKGNPAIDETIRLTLRNLVNAHKSEFVASTFASEAHTPSVGIVMGSRHAGIEESLRASSSERLRSINQILEDVARLVGKEVSDQLRSQLSLITRLDYDEQAQGWRMSVMQDPSLISVEQQAG